MPTWSLLVGLGSFGLGADYELVDCGASVDHYDIHVVILSGSDVEVENTSPPTFSIEGVPPTRPRVLSWENIMEIISSDTCRREWAVQNNG